jgi:hypothetical protein
VILQTPNFVTSITIASLSPATFAKPVGDTGLEVVPLEVFLWEVDAVETRKPKAKVAPSPQFPVKGKWVQLPVLPQVHFHRRLLVIFLSNKLNVPS